MRFKHVILGVLSSVGSLALVAPAWLGAVLPAMIAQPASAQQSTNTQQGSWNAAWGARQLGCVANDTVTPVLVLADTVTANTRSVVDRQDAGGTLGTVEQVTELRRIGLPAQDYGENLTLSDAKSTNVSIAIASDVVAFKGQDKDGNTSFFWGVHTHAKVSSIGKGDTSALQQSSNHFFVYGITTSSETAIRAATNASAVIAQQAAAGSCYSDCMAQEHARHFQNLLDCLTAGGVGGAAGAATCIYGCLGSGPGYVACVTACLTAVGVTVGVIEAACISIYCAAMLGAAIGCAIGCWTCW